MTERLHEAAECACCRTATKTPENWQVFMADCTSCEGRSLLRYPEFEAAMKAGKITKDYQAVLAKICTGNLEGKAEEIHKAAKEWHQRVKGQTNAG